MSKLIINNKIFEISDYENENEIEDALENLSEHIFGGRIYIRIKRRIGDENKSIPDGYLLDLSADKPAIHFIEVELDTHHIMKHIAVQILNFSLSFDEDKKKLIDIIISYIDTKPELKNKCKAYAKKKKYEGVHNLINKAVYEPPFHPIVVINEAGTKLEDVLKKKFTFDVELLTLKKYESNDGEKAFIYDEFAEAISSATRPNISRTKKLIDKSKLDTIIVPARKRGFEEVFIGENRWWQIPISKTMQSQLKYIAAYQIKPIQQVTHIAEIKNIEPWEDTSKYVVNFKDPAQELDQPIDNKFVKGKEIIRVQGPIYAEHSKLIKSKTLKEVWD